MGRNLAYVDDGLLRLFGKRVAALRAERTMTQRDVARKAVIDLTTVSRIERGIGDTTLSTMERIAKSLGSRVVDMLSESGPAKRPAIEAEVAQLRVELEEVRLVAREALRLAKTRKKL